MDQDSSTSLQTNLVIGAPARPCDRKRLKRLSNMLSDLEAVREAHLPEVFEIGSAHPPRPVLFVVVEPASESAAVLETIQARLRGILGRRETLEVRPVPLHFPLLETIRGTKCVVGWRD